MKKQNESVNEIHCVQCGALLAKGFEGHLEFRRNGEMVTVDGVDLKATVICRKCKTLNQLGQTLPLPMLVSLAS